MYDYRRNSSYFTIMGEKIMATLETKIMQVKNDEYVINNINNAMASFGWTVLSVQITHSQNTKTYSSAWDQIGGNQSQTVETTTINYATITYQRSKGLTNYREIVKLEQEFEQVMQQLEAAKEKLARKEAIGCLTMIYWPLLIYKLFFQKKNKKNVQLEKDIRRLEKRRDSILERAEALLD